MLPANHSHHNPFFLSYLIVKTLYSHSPFEPYVRACVYQDWWLAQREQWKGYYRDRIDETFFSSSYFFFAKNKKSRDVVRPFRFEMLANEYGIMAAITGKPCVNITLCFCNARWCFCKGQEERERKKNKKRERRERKREKDRPIHWWPYHVLLWIVYSA